MGAVIAGDVGSLMDEKGGVGCERFEALYAEHFRPLLAYAMRRTAQPASAADVVAETFLVAWRRLDVVPEDGARLWLYTVARRVLANHRRGLRRHERLGQRLGAVAAELVVDDGTEAIGTAALVRDAMDRLQAEDRELLRLATWEGLSGPEIAAVLAIPPGMVRKRLSRARRRLREAIGEPHADGVGGPGGAPGPRRAPGSRSSRAEEGDR